MVQLKSEECLAKLFKHVNGSGICIGGRNLSVEVRSFHPQAKAAGKNAGNLLVDARGHDSQGGQCL